jgi:hypothetical protein
MVGTGPTKAEATLAAGGIVLRGTGGSHQGLQGSTGRGRGKGTTAGVTVATTLVTGRVQGRRPGAGTGTASRRVAGGPVGSTRGTGGRLAQVGGHGSMPGWMLEEWLLGFGRVAVGTWKSGCWNLEEWLASWDAGSCVGCRADS